MACVESGGAHMDSLSRGSSNPEGPSTRIASVSVQKSIP